MTTMLEKMARAMCESESGKWDAASCMETLGGSEPEDMRQGYFDLARAALQAIRELTPEILSDPDMGWRENDDVSETWETVIDTILNEPDRPT